jgi:uncharacterized protein (TIGR01244 family)
MVPAAAVATGNAALAAIDIENFGRVSDTYYRGSQPMGDDYEKLAAAGIKTVIDLQEDFDDHYHGTVEARQVESAGMRFHRIPMTTRTPPTSQQLEQFLSIVNDPAQQPVYVHCKGGKHRTGVMTAVYRMLEDGWTADRAYDEMKDYKFGWSFLHPEFKQFVYDYHDELVASRRAPANTPVAVGATR